MEVAPLPATPHQREQHRLRRENRKPSGPHAAASSAAGTRERIKSTCVCRRTASMWAEPNAASPVSV
jgi:hypothetical protein